MDILGKDCLGGLGIDELLWKSSVKPGEMLIGQYTVTDKRLISNYKRGVLGLEVRIKNQDDKEVLTLKTKILIAV